MRATLVALFTAAAFASVPAAAQTPPPPATVPSTSVAIGTGEVMASNLKGLDVYNAGNEDIGEIADIAFSGNNAVKGYVLSVGGFLGIGSKYVVVEPASLAIAFDNEKKAWRATMNATKDQLKAMPEFKYEGKFKE